MTRTRLYPILPIACAVLLCASCASGGGNNDETPGTDAEGQAYDTTMTQRMHPDSTTEGEMGPDTMGMDRARPDTTMGGHAGMADDSTSM